MMKLTFSRPWSLVVGVGLLIPSLGAGTVWSYVRTAKHAVAASVRDAVPIGFELQRLEQLTHDLIPEIQANQKVAAQLDVEVEYLRHEIATMKDSQAESKAQMDKLRSALGSAGDKHEFGSREFTRAEVEQDLNRRLERFSNAVVQLQAKEKLLATRQQTLGAAVEKIQQYQRQHDVLVEKAESLHGELKLAELAADAHQVDFDKSKLRQAKELAQEVEKRIRIVQKLVDGQTVAGDIPVDVDSRPVTERFDSYFGRVAVTSTNESK